VDDERGRAAELEELNHRLVEAIPGGVVHVAADGSILRANEEAQRILGMSYDSIARRYTQDWDPETICEDGSPFRADDYPVTRALVTGQAQPRVTIGVRRPDGEVSWAVFTAVPLRDPVTAAVTGAIVTFLDITERKQLEHRLRVADRMATVGMLAAGVAHEINNPLTYVMTNLHVLARGLAIDDPKLASRAIEAQEGARRIRDVVRDLSALSHDGDGHGSSGPVDVHEVLEFCVRMLRNELDHRATLVRSFAAGLPQVVADASRLGQVFLNLLNNAIQAIAPGDARHHRIELATRRLDAGRVEIEVADSGPGMAREVLARVFEPFVTTKAAGTGTGLGLYISHSIVAGLGGTITIASEAGQGTRVSVRLPCGAADIERTAPAVPAMPRLLRRARILVVDDEQAICRGLADLLVGHDVVAVDSGRAAIAALDEGEFDLVLCDLLMADLTGMEVHAHARRHQPALATRFVFMTGATSSAQVRQFLQASPGALLEKPFQPADVVQVVAGVLGAAGPG
jgi:two-component system cell cycle sensor histidine kinase/response regulator CckA